MSRKIFFDATAEHKPCLQLEAERSTASKLTVKPAFGLSNDQAGRALENYVLTSVVLGFGSYGEVKLATHIPTGLPRAIKCVSKRRLNRKLKGKVMREAAILKKLDHPNIVKIYDAFEDQDFIYIVLEYFKGKELFSWIKESGSFPEATAASVLYKLLYAINYLHSNHIIHRDIKPENILFDGTTVKLIDFGASTNCFGATKKKSLQGSVYYVAPEVIGRSYSKECDLWSCGVVLYIMLSGVPPFQGSSDKATFAQISNGSFTFDIDEFDNVSASAKGLIAAMLAVDPGQRPTARQALAHCWFDSLPTKEAFSINEQVISRFLCFRCPDPITRFIYQCFVDRVITHASNYELESTFRALDSNKTGILGKEHLKSALEKAGRQVEDTQLDKLMRDTGYKKANAIAYSEFVSAAVKRKAILTADNMERGFAVLDVDQDGYIGQGDLMFLLQEGQEEMQEEIRAALMHSINSLDGRRMGFREFSKALQAML